MFRFDFDLDDSAENPLDLQTGDQGNTEFPNDSEIKYEPSQDVSLESLMTRLPNLISYSPIVIPLTSGSPPIILPRRDLFDARYQLIAEEDPVDATSEGERNKAALDFIEAPSDLVKGVYEGGLKTWECSGDLVEYLEGLKQSDAAFTFWGKSCLEIGCGTALPSCYIFHTLCHRARNSDSETILHLQDYNSAVLELVTLPNLLLTWYMSPLADKYRSTTTETDIAPYPDATQPGELQVTDALKDAFLSSLAESKTRLLFSAGSWGSFRPALSVPRGFDLILTSETIYQSTSLGDLLEVITHASRKGSDTASSLCLIAAKVLYFGVGGGVEEFTHAVSKRGGKTDVVLERREGVGRKILSLRWL